jgi:hypothetical protein
MSLAECVVFLPLSPVPGLETRIQPSQIGKLLLQNANVAHKFQAFLSNILTTSAGFIIDRRNAGMETKCTESLQSSQKFLDAKIGTKSPEAADVARINFKRPSFECWDEFRKNRK